MSHLTATLAGRWHLVAAECPDDEIPSHRVDLIFYDDTSGLRGAILSRVDHSEVPLQSVAFDGFELRLQMGVSPAQPASEPPFLVMKRTEGRFEGGWARPGVEHIRLKLVRARAEGQ